MPDFSPNTIELISGLRQDISALAVSHPEYLSVADNAQINKNNSLQGRPALAATPALSTGLRPAALETTILNTPLALYQGLSFLADSFAWAQAGSFFSTRLMSTPGFDRQLGTVASLIFGGSPVARYNPVPTAQNVAGIPVSSGGAQGFPVFNPSSPQVPVRLTGTSLASFDATSAWTACGASDGSTDAIAYVTAAGALRFYSVQSAGTVSADVQVAAAGSVTVGAAPNQQIWMTAGVALQEFYIVYQSTVAGNVVVLRVNSAGAIQATITLAGLGTVSGVCISTNGQAAGFGGKVCVMVKDTAGLVYKTKILTANAGTFTDTGLNMSHGTVTVAASTDMVQSFTTGLSTGGNAVLCYTDATTNTLVIQARSFTAAALVGPATTFYNTVALGTSPTVDGTTWMAGFPARPVSGIDTIGIYRSSNYGVAKGQWLFIAWALAGTPPLAASPPDSVLVTTATNHYTNSTTLIFGTVDGTAFVTAGVEYGSSTVHVLDLVAPRGARLGSADYFSGVVPYYFDGVQTAPAQFVEAYPTFAPGTSFGGAGGFFQAGKSYSFQAHWEITNAQNQRIRSGVSPVFTATPAAGQFLTAKVTVPQVVGLNLTSQHNVDIKIFQTKANPGPSDPLFLASQTSLPLTSGRANVGLVTFTLSADTDSTQEQLYTTGVVYEDRLTPTADRGIVVSQGRVWAAGPRTLYCSKLLRSNIAPSWNASGGLAIPLPAALGEAIGLADLVDRVLVVGTNGLVVVYGAGADDAGNGPGFTQELIPAQTGPSIFRSPRAVVTIPGGGGAFVGSDGHVYAVNHTGQATNLTLPLADLIRTGTVSGDELTYVPPSRNRGDLLVYGGFGSTLGIFHLTHGQWTTWTSSAEPAYHTSIFGNLHSLLRNSSAVYGYTDTSSGTDVLGGSVAMTVQTSNVSIGGQADGTPANLWGRLRSINPVGKVSGNCTVQVVVSNEGGAQMAGKSLSLTSGTHTNWPSNDSLQEVRMTQQRCSFFTINLQITPALVELSSIDYFSMIFSGRAPARTRT